MQKRNIRLIKKYCIFIFLILIFPPAEARCKQLKPDGIVIHSTNCPYSKTFHYLVKKNGKITAGRPESEIISHIGDKFNDTSLLVMLESGVGDYFNSTISPPQKNALIRTLFGLMAKYDIPLSQIERHLDHDFGCTCPGIGFPYFELMYEMSKNMIKKSGKPLLEDICRKKNISLPVEKAKILIDKSEHNLSLYAGSRFLKSYKLSLSRQPKGDKLKEGDLKTPDGSFYICEKYPMRAWMEISYPDERHAKIALKKNIIDFSQYKSIVSAAKSGGIPYHGSPLGQDVGIHAAGFTYNKMRTNSTAGCPGMEDPEAFELYFAVPIGSKVIIKE